VLLASLNKAVGYAQVDRSALPAPRWSEKVVPPYVPPQNRLEMEVQLIWVAVMNKKEMISCDADFSAVGGNMMHAVISNGIVRSALVAFLIVSRAVADAGYSPVWGVCDSQALVLESLSIRRQRHTSNRTWRLHVRLLSTKLAWSERIANMQWARAPKREGLTPVHRSELAPFNLQGGPGRPDAGHEHLQGPHHQQRGGAHQAAAPEEEADPETAGTHHLQLRKDVHGVAARLRITGQDVLG